MRRMVTLAVPMKVCANPDCHMAGERQPWTNFYAKTKWPDGTMRQPHSRCKACQRVYVARWHREKRLRDPEWARKRTRRLHQSVKSDPERWATELERRRQWKRRKYGYRRDLRRRTTGATTLLAAEPFAAWLNSLDLDTVRNLPASAEVLRRIRNGRQDSVSIDTVDRCCLHMDVRIDDLYPMEDAA